MIFLRDVKLKLDVKYITLGLVFGVLGILSSLVPHWGIFLAVFFFILSFVSALFGNRLQKYFKGHFKDTITLSDTFSAVLRDKNGNIKEERKC